MTDKNPVNNQAYDGGFTAIFRTVGFIGDSLSSGEHESFTNGVVGYHDYYEYSWGQFMARKCGFKAYNFSCGGLTAKSFLSFSDEHECFVKEKACQAYVIALGVNDVSRIIDKVEYDGGFGTTEDMINRNRATFVGCYAKIIDRARETEPNCRIFVVTPPVSDWDGDVRSSLYDDVAGFLRKLPEYFPLLYVIDLRKYAPVYDKTFRDFYYCGGHLNAMGYKYTADVMCNYIDYIIKTTPEDFIQTGFIGKSEYNENYKR
ncbi:MAG: SGNH/GDSL hydrolase family protein [Clostridia bacterium]|nr:SGNH/GDSL hydrolase family protein [Clostridia bacterium]